MTKITAYAVEHLDLLHTLGDAPEGATITGIGRELGRDQSNLTKTLKRLRDEGIVDPDTLALTDAGRAATRMFTPTGDVLADHASLLLRHDQIEPDPDNARSVVDEVDLEDLTQDIGRRSRADRVGLLHALTVLPPAEPGGKWRQRGGYRRWLAIGRLIERGVVHPKHPIPCVRHDGVEGAEAAIMALVENIHHEDLHPLDEGSAYARLVAEWTMSPAEIAGHVKKSAKHVQDRIRLVEALDDDAKRRMRLPKDDPDHLEYAAARRLMQAQNARPKPAVDVDPKEALVLLEIVERHAERPSHDPLAHGRDGWTRAYTPPDDSVAARGLRDKALIEFHYRDGSLVSDAVRVLPAKAKAVADWIADQGAMPLWSARVAVLGAGATADLERASRFATPWLNEPIPEAAAPPAPPPPPADPATQRPPADQAGTSREGAHGAESGSHFEEDEIPPYLRRLATGETPPPRAPSVLPPGEDRSEGSGGPPPPAAPAPEPTFPDLTDDERRIMLEVAAKIAMLPAPGARDAATGTPAYVGAEVFVFHRDQTALRLVTDKRMLAFRPAADRGKMIAVLTSLGEAWLKTVPPLTRVGGAATVWETEWLNKPKPETPAPNPPPLGEGDRAAVEGAGAAAMPRIQGYGLPVLAPPAEIACSNCEGVFELSQDCSDLPSTQQAHCFEFEAETAECPHCKAQLRLAGIVATHVDQNGEPL